MAKMCSKHFKTHYGTRSKRWQYPSDRKFQTIRPATVKGQWNDDQVCRDRNAGLMISEKINER